MEPGLQLNEPRPVAAGQRQRNANGSVQQGLGRGQRRRVIEEAKLAPADLIEQASGAGPFLHVRSLTLTRHAAIVRPVRTSRSAVGSTSPRRSPGAPAWP